MLRTVNAVARALGFVWLGLLAFLIASPGAPSALPVQIACYAVLGLALLAWTVLEASPAAAARYPAWALPVARGTTWPGLPARRQPRHTWRTAAFFTA